MLSGDSVVFSSIIMNKFKLPSLIVIAILFVGCAETANHPVNHAMHAVNNKQEASNDCKSEQTGPAIRCSDTVTASFDSTGTLWLAWINHNQIYVQSSTDKGQSFSDPVLVNKKPEVITAHDEYRPKIEADGLGNVYLTWSMALEKRHTGHIRFSRSTDGGQSFSEPVTVNDNLDEIGHRFDSLALGRNGEVFVAWLDARDKEKAKADKQAHLGSSVYYAWSNDGGRHFQPNQLLAAHSCECCRLAVAVDPENHPVVLWRQVFGDNIRDHALVKFSDWQTPGPVQRASNEQWNIDACPHHGPGLSIGDDGVYHAVWFSGAADKQGLFYAHSTDGGMRFSPAYRFGNPGAKHPHVVAVGRQVSVAWSEFDGSNNVVRLMQSTDGGISWLQPTSIGSIPASADYAFLLTDGYKIYLSWQTAQGYQFKAID